ncbi:hypothetical protein HOLleu_14264 [Holothuria leucospilota]|uniref:Uncharacterized protein n=1 Tax=Holothuria leucospilota TaxID=206669 RepID=A0A9Q1C822_HOLLE|nr:hypothetical protein HOLleu_14264 [Holothuria leucospilota]
MAEISFDLNFDLTTLDDMETEENAARFANLAEEDLDDIGEGRNEKSTKKSTKWGVKLLKGLFFAKWTIQSIVYFSLGPRHTAWAYSDRLKYVPLHPPNTQIYAYILFAMVEFGLKCIFS